MSVLNADAVFVMVMTGAQAKAVILGEGRFGVEHGVRVVHSADGDDFDLGGGGDCGGP